MERCSITISRTTSNVEDDYVGIEIFLNRQVIKLKLSMEEYAFLITGLGHVKAKVDRNYFKEKK